MGLIPVLQKLKSRARTFLKKKKRLLRFAALSCFPVPAAPPDILHYGVQTYLANTSHVSKLCNMSHNIFSLILLLW